MNAKGIESVLREFIAEMTIAHKAKCGAVGIVYRMKTVVLGAGIVWMERINVSL